LAKRKLPHRSSVFSDEVSELLSLQHERPYGDADVMVYDHLPTYSQTEKDADKSVWEEEGDSSNTIYDSPTQGLDKGALKGATLNVLILKLVDSGSNYRTVIFYTYHLYTNFETVFVKLKQLYDPPEEKANKREAIQKEVLILFKFWVTTCTWDWNNEKRLSLLDRFLEGVHSSLPEYGSLRKEVNELLLKLNRKKQTRPVDKLVDYHFIYDPKNPPPEPIVPKNIFSPSLKVGDIAELEVARQMTVLEFAKFSDITPLEVLHYAKDPEAKIYDGVKSDNKVHKYLERWEGTKRWVMCDIMRGDGIKVRSKLLRRYIKIAEV